MVTFTSKFLGNNQLREESREELVKKKTKNSSPPKKTKSYKEKENYKINYKIKSHMPQLQNE